MVALSKLKAVFQLAPLSVLSAQDIPAEAIERSILALNTLLSLCSLLEEKRNQRKTFNQLITHFSHFFIY